MSADVAGTVPAASRWSRERPAQLAGLALVLIAGGAWAALALDPGIMRSSMPGMDGTATMAGMGRMGPTITAGAAVSFVAAWAVMMAAMMLPSAVPMIGLYATVRTKMSARSGRPAVATTGFASMYLLVWALTGIPVYLVAAELAKLSANHPGLHRAGPYAVAGVLVAAGAYQLSRMKAACLTACRGPLQFLSERWRHGVTGTLRVGAEHALYCLGCCWALMVVLVAAGAMGLAWTLLVAALVFMEKVVPGGDGASRFIGAALVLLGAVVAVHSSVLHQIRL